MLLPSNQLVDLIVIGGGPAGFMAAITAAENGVSSVVLVEATEKVLDKVRISGGGRCNVTHACWDPLDLVNNYPRGKLSLLGGFSRFATGDAVAWFAEKGLDLHTEPDGRMFPKSNSSFEVISCLRRAARSVGVKCITKYSVRRLDYLKTKEFFVHFKNSNASHAKRVVIATGSHPSGRRLATNLGHQIVDPVPALFSFNLEESSLNSCAGVSINDVNLKLLSGEKRFKEIGRVLITHWGLSGPAILRLSSFAARELNKDRYKAILTINWINSTYPIASNLLNQFRYDAARMTLANARPYKKLPKNFWLLLLRKAGINPSMRWSEFSSLLEKRLINILISDRLNLFARGPYGEEFVTAGGVNLKEIDFVTMESRLLPGLYFVGEVLDVDGLTGGFNFQHCWTSGWLAGKAIANSFDFAN